MAFLDPLLSPIIQPLLDVNPFFAIVVLALGITLLITLAYKFLTNQNEMKRLKGEQKEFQQRMKTLRKENKHEEMMKVQKEAMSKNMEYMKHSMKATLITFIPIILIFGWMNAHLVYDPISPGERFAVTVEFVEGIEGSATLVADEGLELKSPAEQPINSGVTWNVKAVKEGDFFLTVKADSDEQSKKVLVTKKFAYEEPSTTFQNSDIKTITLTYKKFKPINSIANGEVSIFGWQPGWLGLYIIFSIVFSIVLRKVMKVH
jgi:uncharacterized membrane protein (DUF106 family)